MYEVTSAPIDPHIVIDSVRGKSAIGATVSFIGSLRGHSADGKPLRFAECDKDSKSAKRLLQQVDGEIRDRWQLEGAAICHRVGRIEVGDVVMVVAVAARHRQEAFAACQYAVDRAKDGISIREIL
jgi:molybdopterin synthase catalytic subunit